MRLSLYFVSRVPTLHAQIITNKAQSFKKYFRLLPCAWNTLEFEENERGKRLAFTFRFI